MILRGYSFFHPPDSLTLNPCFCSSLWMVCRWSPWMTIVPSLIEPPVPHWLFRFLAICFRSSMPSWNPEIDVTVFPLRPFFSLWIRMIPSNRVFPRERVLFPLQEQLLAGFPQPGQIRPDSVEYTKREVSVICCFPHFTRTILFKTNKYQIPLCWTTLVFDTAHRSILFRLWVLEWRRLQTTIKSSTVIFLSAFSWCQHLLGRQDIRSHT